MASARSDGAAAELLAAAALIAAGFLVFRNVAPTGSADLIALKNGHAIPVDVKTATLDTKKRARRSLPTWVTRGASPSQLGEGIVLIHVYDGHVDISPVIKRHLALSSLSSSARRKTVAPQATRATAPTAGDDDGQG